MKISTNVGSLSAVRRLQNVQRKTERENLSLSTGDRIYQAAYDPAGLAISEGLKAKARSEMQAKRNVNDGISLVQVAEGSLAVLQGIGSRMKELAVQAATDTVDDNTRALIMADLNQTREEYKRITQGARYNGKYILNGRGSNYELQVGVGSNASENRVNYDLSKILGRDFGINKLDLSSKTGAQQSLEIVDKLTREVSHSRAELGSVQNRLQTAMGVLEYQNENTEAANSRIRDTDVAQVTASRAISKINNSATIESLKLHNMAPEKVMKLIG